MITKPYNIVRRAFSVRTIVETIDATFVAAELRAMAMQADKNDGEYFAVPAEHGDRYPQDGGADQSMLAIAWL